MGVVRQVEVEELRAVVECQQDVGGFDIAVMDLACMSIRNRAGERADDPGHALAIGAPHRVGTPPRVALEGLHVGKSDRRDDLQRTRAERGRDAGLTRRMTSSRGSPGR